jgi:hypothetical protein
MKDSFKDLFKKGAFPDVLAPDEVKSEDSYGIQFAKQIEHEWFFRPEQGPCSYYDKREKYHNLRLYARGEQDTTIYKKLLGGEDSTYANYDWRPLQVLPKFVKLIVNQMTERLFDVKAEATDKFSTDMKDKHKKNLERMMLSKPVMKQAKEDLGIDLMPDDIDTYPDTQEEIDLFMKLKYKPAIEIAAEEAIKYTLDLNDYDETQSRVIEDITTIGLGAVKHSTDPSKGIVVEYIDPANLVHSYPTHRNFKDVNYYGEVKRMTLNELKRVSNGKFSDEEMKEVADTTGTWSRYHGNETSNNNLRDDDLSGMMVDVMHFTFKSTKTLSYKKKFSKNGGYKMTKKESTFSKKDDSYTGYDVSKKIIDVWYEGSLILGTEKIYNYKMCENMIRPEGYLNITQPNYLLYAPDLYQNRTLSTVEKVIPYIDQMQQIHIKLQQVIAKARPNGIYIDVAGLSEITLGDGNVLTPLEAIKIYDETGNVLGTSSTVEGDYNYGREPIRELKNGVIDGLDRLIGAYNHYLGLLRDAIGIPQGADASLPHPDTLVGVQQMAALNSNTATRHILDAGLNISVRLGKSLSLRIKDIFEYSDLKSAYINAIGKSNVKTLEALKKYHIHDLGINIELKPDAQEKQYLEANIAQALARDIITLDDAIDIRNIGNIKLANELLKTRRIKKEKEKKANEQELIKAQGESQGIAAQKAGEARQMEIQAKNQSDLALVDAKSKAKMAELEKEAEVKSVLMQKEFDFNMQLQGLQVNTKMQSESQKEDRKDSRQDRANTQQSELIDQRQKNSRPKNFESSEDNISGSVELGEMTPS